MLVHKRATVDDQESVDRRVPLGDQRDRELVPRVHADVPCDSMSEVLAEGLTPEQIAELLVLQAQNDRGYGCKLLAHALAGTGVPPELAGAYRGLGPGVLQGAPSVGPGRRGTGRAASILKRSAVEHEEKWIGVDLDSSLATYNGWKGIEHIGKPIPRMVQRVKRWLREGKRVKIFTARVANGPEAEKYIRAWCKEHIGQELEVTNVKDPACDTIWDDRAVRVQKNTGKQINKTASRARKLLEGATDTRDNRVKQAGYAKTQALHAKLMPPNMNKEYRIDIPDVWKFINENPGRSTTVDPAGFAAVLHMNPWVARSIKEILADYKTGTPKLTHAKRMLEADDRPISMVKYPEGVEGVGEKAGQKYYIIDGYHRLARALADGDPSLNALIHNFDWKPQKKRGDKGSPKRKFNPCRPAQD